jgi:hypothetical protein
MNVKLASLAIIVLLSWSLVGGCPVSDNTTLPDDGAAADSNGDGSAADGGTSSGAASGSTDGGSDGSADGGSASDDGGEVDGGSADNGSPNGDDQDDGDQDGTDDGDQGDGDQDGDEVTPVFEGTYTGELACHKKESLLGTPGAESDWTRTFSFSFDENGLPTAFVIPGYMQAEGGVEFVAEVSQLGESVTLEESFGTFTATLTVTVVAATYNETDARVVLSLEHYGDQPGVPQEGTGMHVVQYELDDGDLAYSATTTYEVLLGGQFDTTWEVACEGTLPPEE